MSEAERFCDEKATIIVPRIALNYDGNMLESVGIGGEMFRRETPLSAENRLLKAENAKLRKYITAVANDVYGSNLFNCMGCRFFDGCYNDEKKEHDGRGCQWLLWARELGIEVM